MTIAEMLLEKGYHQGISQGISQGSSQAAKRMLAENVDLLFISRMTGLSLEQIKEIQNEMVIL